MTLSPLIAACGLTLALVSSAAFAGVVDRDCTPGKAKDAARNASR